MPFRIVRAATLAVDDAEEQNGVTDAFCNAEIQHAIAMKITLNEHILAGGNAAHEQPEHFEIEGQRHMQILQAIRADNVQTFNRGNLQIQLKFTVGRRHKTAAEAVQHALTHACALMHASGSLHIDLEDKAQRQLTLESATLQHIKTRYKGNASYTTYEIYGGNLHDTQQ